MKKLDFLRELRNLNLQELKLRAQEFKARLLEIRIKLKEGLGKNPLMLRSLRREIAVINTVLREKERKS